MMSELCYLAAISSMMDTKLFEHARQKIPFFNPTLASFCPDIMERPDYF